MCEEGIHAPPTAFRRFLTALERGATTLAIPARRLMQLGFWHWTRVLLLIAIGLCVEHMLEHAGVWKHSRFLLYRTIHNLAPTHEMPVITSVVLIDDQAYWKGSLAAREPIKRDYLARLLFTLDAANPAVIALDFDLSSPVAHSKWSPESRQPTEHPDYQIETDQLVEAINEVSKHRPIVLPRTTRRISEAAYEQEAAVYDAPSGDPRIRPGTHGVLFGYIEASDDIRRIPLGRSVGHAATLDSLSQAIVRAYNPALVTRVISEHRGAFPFASYIPVGAFDQYSSQALLDGTQSLQQLRHRVLLVGASWHSLGYKRGPLIDAHDTPEGRIGGVFVHANYVEALIDDRTYTPVSPVAMAVLDVSLLLLVAIVQGLIPGTLAKVATGLGAVLVFIVINYILLHNLGMFCDFLIPLVLLALHPVVEQILDWRDLANSRPQAHT